MTTFSARLTDAEWAVFEPQIPANRPGGRPPKYVCRAVVDAIVYVARQGMTWRALPAEFPHCNTAFWYFQEWQNDGTWGRVEDAARAVRLAEACASATQSAGAVDSQTVKGTEQPGPHGFDQGKKATGVKRHSVVDTLGLVSGLAVTPPCVADCKGARAAAREAQAASGGRLIRLRADSAYRGLVACCWVLFDLTVEVVTRREGRSTSRSSPAVGAGADVRVADAVAADEPELRAHTSSPSGQWYRGRGSQPIRRFAPDQDR